jgi:hypothetical protein
MAFCHRMLPEPEGSDSTETVLRSTTRVGDVPFLSAWSIAASSKGGLWRLGTVRSFERGWSSGSGTRCLYTPRSDEVHGARLPAAGWWPFPRPVLTLPGPCFQGGRVFTDRAGRRVWSFRPSGGEPS